MPIFVPVDEVVEPPIEPFAPISPIYNHGFTLIGADASRWDLVSGPVHILAGASGFGFPEPDHRWSESPVTDGAIHRGLRYPSREFALPLEVDGRYLLAGEWRDLERDFWRALNPRHDCHLIVTSPTGEVRTITFRYAGGGDPSFELDPLLREDNVYPLECVAGEPFWSGGIITREYVVAPGVTTFPGPPFSMTDSTAISTTTVVTNPGDEDSWPRWVTTGPYTEVTVGVADGLVTIDVPVSAGQSRIIDMNPSSRSIKDQAGNLRWSDASELSFAAIPGNMVSTMVMAMSGGVEGESSIGLEFDSRYLRAFS